MGGAMASDRALLVSSDGHVGPPTQELRPYIEKKYLRDFDEYLAAHRHKWAVLAERDPSAPEVWSEERRAKWRGEEKVQSGGLQGLVDPRRRIRELETDGIVVDVMFPDEQSENSAPFSAGLVREEFDVPDRKEYTAELKAAGARAYNRWLADFCSVEPDRLLGLALIGSLADVDEAVKEIRRVRESGLRAGILLPLHYTGLPFYNDERYEPLWAACAELDMPVHSHAGDGIPN